jgi:hypothetical protein
MLSIAAPTDISAGLIRGRDKPTRLASPIEPPSRSVGRRAFAQYSRARRSGLVRGSYVLIWFSSSQGNSLARQGAVRDVCDDVSAKSFS